MKIQITLHGEKYIRDDQTLELNDVKISNGFINVLVNEILVGYIQLDEILPALHAFNSRVMGELIAQELSSE